VDPKELKGDSMAIQKTRKQTLKKLEEICAVLENQGIKTRPNIYIGDKTEEIQKAADESRATMIAAGSVNKKNRWIDLHHTKSLI
jgi:nucleotide-binding universal stress UspA family protein